MSVVSLSAGVLTSVAVGVNGKHLNKKQTKTNKNKPKHKCIFGLGSQLWLHVVSDMRSDVHNHDAKAKAIIAAWCKSKHVVKVFNLP